jgi:TPR repeat protein
VPKDESKAIEFWRKALDLGDVRASNNIGLCYLDGVCVDKDYAKAVQCFETAVNAGVSQAMINLGFC